MDTRDHFRNFQNNLRTALTQSISQEHPITLEQLASGVSNQGFFARNLNEILGRETISNSEAIAILSKNNFELFHKINDLFIKSQDPQNAPPLQPNRPDAEHRFYPQYSYDMATLNQLVKLVNKPKIGDVIIEQTKQPEIAKIKEYLQAAQGVIVLMANKQIGLDVSLKHPDQNENRVAGRKNVKAVMKGLGKEFNGFMEKAEATIRALPESTEKTALIKEYMKLSDLMKSENLVKDTKKLREAEANKPMTQKNIEISVVSNFTNVFGAANPYTEGDLNEVSSFKKPFHDLAKLHPNDKTEINAAGNSIQAFGKLCAQFEPHYRAAIRKENPVPVNPKMKAEVQSKIDDLREQISFQETPKVLAIPLGHFKLRLNMAEKRLNELP